MNYGIAYHQTRSYTVSTPLYEGPLDLLLHLIERAELDITKLALAKVTDQYLEHLKSIEESVPEEVSGFLVVAARLLQIKSEMLLPRPPARQPEEVDPADILARQLIVYKRFKELSNYLAERETANLRTYLRLAPIHKIEGNVDLDGLTLNDMVTAAYSVLLDIDSKPALASVVTPPRITIREKIMMIARYLQKNHNGTFTQLLSYNAYRLEVVVTFLALLELVKRSLIQTHQEQLFGEIGIESSSTWEDNTSFDLEFGE
jgi:segregation and condensation protein A